MKKALPVTQLQVFLSRENYVFQEHQEKDVCNNQLQKYNGLSKDGCH